MPYKKQCEYERKTEQKAKENAVAMMRHYKQNEKVARTLSFLLPTNISINFSLEVKAEKNLQNHVPAVFVH